MTIKTHSNRRILSLLFASAIISIVLNSVIVDRVCVLLIFIACIRLGAKEKTFINPYYLFALTPLSLIIYVNISNFYMMELTHKTWVLAIINMLAFIFALSVTPSFKHKRNFVGGGSNRSLKINAAFLFALSLLGKVFPMFESILWLFAIPAMVCALKTKEKSMILLVFVYILIIVLGEVSKMAILMYCLTLLISYDKYYVVSAKQNKRIKLFAILGIVFMVFAFSFANKDRGHYDADVGISHYTQNGVEWQFSNSLFLPYMYMTSAWTNVQYVTETQDTRTYGLWMIKPFLGYLQVDEYFKQEYSLTSNSSFNTFTFITCGFKDFGYWLSLLSALFLGFFVKKVYSRYKVSQSPFDVAIYICVGLAVAEMFFSNHFFMQSYPFTIVIVMGIYRFPKRIKG